MAAQKVACSVDQWECNPALQIILCYEQDSNIKFAHREEFHTSIPNTAEGTAVAEFH
jgi:hypothetical protein